MAFYMLHSILFPITKLLNQHLLLDEFYHLQRMRCLKQNRSSLLQVTGASQQTSSSLEQAEFISIHTLLLGISLFSFVFSHKSLDSLHHHNQHLRSYLLRLLMVMLVSILGYLYTVNTIASLHRTKSNQAKINVLLQYTHAIVLLLFFAILQWSQFVVGSICDTIGVRNQSRYKADDNGARSRSLASQLIAGTFSVAFASLSLSELFDSNNPIADSKIEYTNIVLMMAALSVTIELVCFHLLTTGRKQEQSKTVSLIGLGESVGMDRNSIDIGNRKDLPPVIWSISSKNAPKGSETAHSADDEEFDNSDMSCQTCADLQLSKGAQFCRANQPQVIWRDVGGDVELFDRSKYSLYDESEYRLEDELDVAKKCRKQAATTTCQQPQAQGGQVKHLSGDLCQRFEHYSSVLEVLLAADRFVWHTIALVFMGTVYQANQLCYFSEYIDYLLHKSPRRIRWTLQVSAGPVAMRHQHQHERASLDSVWISLICISILAQSLSRVLVLQSASYIRGKLGLDRLFWLLLVVSITVPCQFICNYYLIETSDSDVIPLKTRTIMILSHILLIQLMVGFLGALVDFIIIELTFKYSLLLENYRMSKVLSPDKSNGAIQCTVHGLFNGSFLFIGTAIMSAIRIFADNAGRDNLE